MVHDNLPAGIIITQGLGGTANQWIIAQFHVFLGIEVAVEISTTLMGGTSFRPEVYYPPRPDNEDEVVWEPREDEEYEVIIRVSLGKRDVERHYFVRKRTTVVVTQVLHFLNTTTSRISVGVGVIKKTAKDITIALRNLGKKS